MSALYSGRQGPTYEDRPSYESDEIGLLYRQAMHSLQNEGSDGHGANAPAPGNAYSHPNTSNMQYNPQGTAYPATNGNYGTPLAHPTQLPQSFNQTQGAPAPRGGRSRPLPAVPGGGPNRPQVQVPVPPPGQYGTDYKAPLPGMQQSSHADNQYSTPAPPSHIPLKQPPADPEYPRTHLNQDSYSTQPRHRTQDSGFTDSNSSHLSSYHQFDSPYSLGNTYDNQYNPYPNGPPSHQHVDPSAYHQNDLTNPALSRPDHINGYPQSTDDHRGTMATNMTGSSSYSGEALLSGPGGNVADPRIEQYRPHGQGSFLPVDSPDSAQQIHSSPINAQMSEDVGTELGSHLLRSTSTTSSFNSLLQEPRRSPTTFEDGLLTPTLSRAELSLEASVPPSQTSHSYASNSYLDADTYSSSLAYGAPAIITTSADVIPGSSRRRHHQQEYQRMASMKGPLGLHADEEEEEEDEELEEDRFVNLALLSHLANRLRDRIPRGTHVKGSIPYPRAFTGKDIVSTIQTLIQKEFQSNMGFVITDRRPALQVARSLQGQLFFYEVEWGGRILQDGLEDVYMFLDDNPASEGSNAEYRHDRVEREELPTGVITLLTKCYAPSCQEGSPCYTYTCPRRTTATMLEGMFTGNVTAPEPVPDTPWGEMVDKQTLNSLPEAEIRRQTIISKVIMKEQQYVQDLDLIETIFIKELRRVNPPIIAPENLEDFISEVFGNFFELRQCNRRILDVMLVRQREQGPIIQRIGDIFLGAAAEFRSVYPLYVGNLPVAEKRIKEEAENNPAFRRFLEQSSRQDTRGLDMKHFIYRPSEHLQKYPVLLEAIFKETAEGNPDADFLVEAEQAIRNLSTVAQLRTFQSAMGRGPTGKWEWHDLVPKEIRNNVTKQESQRQAIIWELIKGEMVYVKDLETIDTLFIRPLRESEIIPPDRLPAFLQDVFHNFAEIHGHHRRMLERLHEIQREEHPFIRSITAPVFDAALNWRDAYLEYIPHYPIAAFKIDDEMANNPSFKAFIDQCIRHPDSRRLDLKAFINRPIPRLLRYELLLKNILEATPPGNEDHDTIPQVLEVIKDLGKSSEPGVQSAKQKVELWGYHTNLVFKPGEYVDMDLLHETRTLIHAGKLLRQPETGFDLTGGWTDLFVLLFDNYLVFTKPREKDGIVKYHVNRRPIPLDLLTLPSSMEPPILRNTGLLRPRTRTVMSAAGDNNNTLTGLNAGDPVDNRYVYPIHIHHNGRTGGIHTVFAESAQARAEWRMKLEEGLGLRKVVQESNKVFEIETLSIDTFLVPAVGQNMTAPSWNEEGMFTGNVTCSVPFTTPDGRGLVAIGCAEGVWIGLQHDSKSMRRVLHLKLVTQCAMLEDFGIFLVLADKSLFAYHIEALVPSNPPSPHASRTPQKLNGNKDVQFFSVGTMGGRTLIIYMKRRGMDSVFRVLEPVVERITEKAKAPAGFGRFAFGNNRSEWFRVFRDFFLPSEAYDLYFLKAKIAILCSKGFEVMDLTDFKSVTIPQREDPRLAPINRRLETCKPLGMFRSSENEFLLCYTEFGLYVNRHGDPSRQVVVVEWEGTAVRAACHPPYVLLFDSRFIEIRHIETGRLAQIIPGNDVRCLWDGRGGSAPPLLTPGPDGWQEGGAQDARVHASMRLDEIANANMRPGMRGAAQQHVFELLPTIPLYLPGSLASPSQSTYFPQSSSPPHSPRLNPAWRG